MIEDYVSDENPVRFIDAFVEIQDLKECSRNVEVMWLLKNLTPDFKTIADFRKDNPEAIKKLFKSFVFFCKQLDLFGGEVVGIDGSKFKAVNSKKRNFNEDKLIKKLKDIEEKIEQLKERKSEYKELLNKLETSSGSFSGSKYSYTK